MNPIFFTHIPKTASTSLQRGVIESKVAEEKQHRFSGLWSALKEEADEFDFLGGHYPYGVHRLYGVRDPRYFVMLREPVDRAISYYYFVRAANSSSYTHPRAEEVRENTLLDFYQKPEFQNVQARFVAGWWWQLLGRRFTLGNQIGKVMVSQAKRHLYYQYEAFGLKERFQESAELIASRIRTSVRIPERRHQKTPDRPEVSDLDENTVRTLRSLNRWDVALYQFAVEHFEQQFDE
jgi:hypothetical protein